MAMTLASTTPTVSSLAYSTITRPDCTSSIMRTGPTCIRVPTEFSMHKSSNIMVVPPDVLDAIKRFDSYVVSRVETKACKQAFDVLNRPEVLSCLEIIKYDSVYEVFLRACTAPPRDTSVKLANKGHQQDTERIWRLNSYAIDQIRTNIMGDSPVYTAINKEGRITKVIENLKVEEVEHDGNGKSSMKAQLVDKDYPRIWHIDDAIVMKSVSTLAASKTKATERASRDYEKFDAPLINVRKRHFELDVAGSNVDGPGIKVFKIANALDAKLVEMNGEKLLVIIPTPVIEEEEPEMVVEAEE